YVGPKKAAALLRAISGLPATLGNLALSSMICGGIGLIAGGPEAGFFAAGGCAILSGLGVWQLSRWLQQGVDDNQYAVLTISLGILSKPAVHLYHSPVYPC